MNRLFIALLGLVLMAALPSCDEEEDYDGGPIYVYNLLVKAVDADGNDLVDGIKHEAVGSSGYGSVATDEYTLSGPWWLAPASVFVGGDGEEYFALGGILQNADFEKTVSVALTCPHIFGDDAAHEIVSQWQEMYGPGITCTSVTVDGRDCPVSFAGGKDQYRAFVTTVVVDRR